MGGCAGIIRYPGSFTVYPKIRRAITPASIRCTTRLHLEDAHPEGETHMVLKLQTLLKMTALGLVMMFGTLAIAPVAAQDVPDAAAVEEDGGFDDWGLLGLLGLAGLAGLRKRSEPGVRTIERPVGTQR